MIRTFFSVDEGLRGAPGLQGHLEVTLGPPGASQLYLFLRKGGEGVCSARCQFISLGAVETHTLAYPLPLIKRHVVPPGQHAKPEGHDTALAHGQQPCFGRV